MSNTLSYLLYFIPLMSSVFIYFLEGKRFLSNVGYLILMTLTIFTIKIFSSIDPNTTIIVNSTATFNIIGTEFKLDIFNIFFLVNILFINFIGFINYVDDLVLTKKKDIGYIKHFFSIYFLHIFSTIGILLTDNIFHLFIFLELYSFSNYIIITNYKDTNLNILSYKYFSNNIFGSILNMLSIFYMLVYFNTSSIFLIKQQLLTIRLEEYYNIFLIILLFVFSVVIRFFTNSVSRYHNTDYKTVNFISISNIFVNSLLGIFLLSNVIFYILPTENIFNLFFIDKIFIYLSIISIIYNSILLFKKENYNSIFNIFIRLNLIGIFYTVIAIFLYDDVAIVIDYVLDFLFISLTLYFFSDMISLKYKTNNIAALNNSKFLKVFFIVILLYRLYLPIASSFIANKYFFISIFSDKNYIFLVPFIVNKISIVFIIFKVLVNKNIIERQENSDTKTNKRLLLTTYFSIFLVILFMFFFVIYF